MPVERRTYRRGDRLVGGIYPGEFVPSTREQLRKSIKAGVLPRPATVRCPRPSHRLHLASATCPTRPGSEAHRRVGREDRSGRRTGAQGTCIAMIIFGICATPAADISGHILLRDAINCSQRDVPLYFEHKHRIGTVTRLNYAGDRLYIHAETDDADALRLGYFSPAGKPLDRIQSGRLWHVSKFRLEEVIACCDPEKQILCRDRAPPDRSHARVHQGPCSPRRPARAGLRVSRKPSSECRSCAYEIPHRPLAYES